MIRKSGSGALLQRGGMQTVASNAANGLVEIAYEHALHETSRERVPPAVALKLVLAIFRRDRLCRVEVPQEYP